MKTISISRIISRYFLVLILTACFLSFFAGKSGNNKSYIYLGEFNEGFARAKNGEGWFHVNQEYKPIYSKIFSDVGNYSEGVAPALEDNVWFHINTKGKAVYEKRYYWVDIFSENLAVAVEKDENGVEYYFHIDHNGEPAYSERFDEASSFKNHRAKVSKNNETFFISSSGQRIK
ncbi:MAG: WG repeat-containing protein [Planctomycetes bacterium]|nr:WG repeat-containing protein [Planctomycetota bacterium]